VTSRESLKLAPLSRKTLVFRPFRPVNGYKTARACRSSIGAMHISPRVSSWLSPLGSCMSLDWVGCRRWLNKSGWW